MTVLKALVCGILIASLASSTARGGSSLSLSVGSGDDTDLPVVSSSTSTPASGLQLGVFSDAGPIFNPTLISSLPINWPTPPILSAVPAPVDSAPYVAQAPSPSGRYDAFINFSSGPFADSASLTTPYPQPWYLGTSVDRLFGGLPSIQQAGAFEAAVLNRVRQTFALGGIPVTLTNDPTALAAHSISVVSNASNPTVPGALGMTYLGANGFQYIDVAANSASNVDQLEWIVAHNLAHEMMLAFHVPEVHDQSGQSIDAPNANWWMMTNPAATFSPGAIADLLGQDFQATGGAGLNPSAQQLGPPTVPEPTSLIFWAAVGWGGLVAGRSHRKSTAGSRS